MNIVVLAGGLSTERDVSLSSGSMVADALQKQGHRVALVDAFFGLESLPDPVDSLFSSEKKADVSRIGTEEPDLEKIRAMRGDSGFGEIGKNVIEVCRAADLVYLGLHGENGENGRIQAMFDVLGIRYTGSGLSLIHI